MLARDVVTLLKGHAVTFAAVTPDGVLAITEASYAPDRSPNGPDDRFFDDTATFPIDERGHVAIQPVYDWLGY